MNRMVILGCGPVGRHIAIDLCKDPACEIISVDINQDALEHLAKKHPVQIRVEDLSTVEGVTRAVEDADIVIIAYGFTARSALFALQKLRQEGKKVGLLRLKTIWPFAELAVKEISKTAKKIFIPEMNLGQIAGEIKKHAVCEVISYQQSNGRVIHPQRIIEEIRSL